MAFTVVLDTCVLYSAHLRDSLLRIAERGLCRALWSDDILVELDRNLAKTGMASSSIEHLLTQMNRAFPGAKVTGYRDLVPAMTCDEKDRHVLAAAVRADAAAIITFNISDFPDASVDPFEVDVIHPDAFLLDLLDLSPSVILNELDSQASANRREPKSVPVLLGALTRAGAPRFADEVLRRL